MPLRVHGAHAHTHTHTSARHMHACVHLQSLFHLTAHTLGVLQLLLVLVSPSSERFYRHGRYANDPLQDACARAESRKMYDMERYALQQCPTATRVLVFINFPAHREQESCRLTDILPVRFFRIPAASSAAAASASSCAAAPQSCAALRLFASSQSFAAVTRENTMTHPRRPSASVSKCCVSACKCLRHREGVAA